MPDWVVVSSATAIALGTYVGGWRIIKTMGSRIHKMDSAQGFAAQGAGATVILAASHVGFPLSTTHTITGAVIGSGAAKRLSAVRWGVAGNIVVAWILTLPGAAVIGGLTYVVTRAFGTGRARADRGVRRDRRGEPVLFARRSREGARPAWCRPPRAADVIATIVDWDALLQVIWVSLLAGVAVPAACALRDPRDDARARVRPRRARGGGRGLRGRGRRSGVAVVLGAIVFGIVILIGD